MMRIGRGDVVAPLTHVCTPRCASCKATRVSDWGGSRSSPWVMLVNVKFRTRRGISVDCAQQRLIDGRVLAEAAQVNLQAPILVVALGAADAAALGVPIA
eukprot:scaffold192860_cov37-Tisochrysis_lutea.AAC.4